MIKYIDLGVTEKEYEEQISPRLKEIFLSGDFISDKYVKRFEESFAAYCGSKYAIAVNSGTDALILSLKSLGIGEGDEVITVSNSFIATANAIVEVGATPVFVDINDDLLIDISKIEVLISDKTKAIIPVHLMGNVCDMAGLVQVARKYNLKIIEDAAQSVGSEYKNDKTGTMGIIGCFSLHPLKNLSGITDGGIITTDDSSIASYLRKVRNHGLQDRDKQVLIGGVSRLNNLNAIILDYRLGQIESIINERRVCATHYESSLKKQAEVETIKVSDEIRHSYHTYVIIAEQRDELMQYLHSNSIDCKIHYPVLIHQQPAYKNMACSDESLVKTLKMSKNILTLPISNVTVEDIEYICQCINDFYKNK